MINQQFKQYIKIIGRGQRSGATLTQSQAFDAMSMIINQQVTPDQRGAFLMLLRVREETSEELAGFVEALRLHTDPSIRLLDIDIDMGCYAGKRRHLPWFLLAVMAMAQSGKRFFLHGTNEPDSNRLYLNSVLPSLGIPVATSVQQAQQVLDHLGFVYMDLKHFNPALEQIIQLRAEFGLRSCANTLARMLNPSRATFSLQGVFHRHVDAKHNQTSRLLGDQNALCFRGEGGEIEYNPERKTDVFVSRGGNLSTASIEPMLSKPMIKPKSLDVTSLIKVWEGTEDAFYGQRAVTGTIAIMCMLTEELDSHNALIKAQAIWAARDKHWPIKLNSRLDSDQVFSTTGKQYSH